MRIPFGHVEGGARCGNRLVPEEVNRMYIDSVADVCFCTAAKDLANVDNGVLVGDLEYELLNSINPTVTDGNYGVMTLHRRENMNLDRVGQIFNFVGSLRERIVLPIHHSLRKTEWFKAVEIPSNVEVIPAAPYTKMVALLGGCKYILTDSGSIPKIAPFFGKRCLVMRSEIGWTEAIESGHVKTASLTNADRQWLSRKIVRRKDFYLPVGRPSAAILGELSRNL